MTLAYKKNWRFAEFVDTGASIFFFSGFNIVLFI